MTTARSIEREVRAQLLAALNKWAAEEKNLVIASIKIQEQTVAMDQVEPVKTSGPRSAPVSGSPDQGKRRAAPDADTGKGIPAGPPSGK
jgi:hypothetical protein